MSGIRRRACFKLIYLVLVVCSLPGALAPGSEGVDSHLSELRSSPLNWTNGDTADTGPVCGIYSACNALTLLGFDCLPQKYISLHFVPTDWGSSSREIVAIAEDVKAKATVVSGLSAYDLIWMDSPVVANVRATPFEESYKHWVVVLFQEGELVVYDGAKEPERIPVAEFLGIWNGVGVLISRQGEDVLHRVWLGRLILLQVGILLAVIVRGVWLRLRCRSTVCLKRDTILVGGATLLVTVASVVLFGDWRNYYHGVQTAIAPFLNAPHKRATLDDLDIASRDPKTLIVDARTARDYQSGSIQNAVNIPVYCSVGEIRKRLLHVNKDTRVIAFCQSASCSYSETVASSLTFLGFTNVAVCDEGWIEYGERFSGDRR